MPSLQEVVKLTLSPSSFCTALELYVSGDVIPLKPSRMRSSFSPYSSWIAESIQRLVALAHLPPAVITPVLFHIKQVMLGLRNGV